MNLAVRGASPFRRKPYHKWPLQDDDVRARLETLFEGSEWGRASSGTVAEFERKFAWYHDCKFAASALGAPLALTTAIKALKIGPGDEVLLSAYCDPMLPKAVVDSNAVPIFADIRPDCLDLDPESLDRRVTERTKALVISHVTGCVANMDELMVVARRYQMKVIEDCLQAAGAEFDNRKVGSMGDLGVFCFGENRLLSAGAGGIITSNHKELTDRCSALLHDGQWPSSPSDKEFLIGTSGAMLPLQASVLLAQLGKLDDMNLLRAERSASLMKLLDAIPGVSAHKSHPLVSRQALNGVPIKINPAEFHNTTVARFVEALRAEGIPCAPGHAPAHDSNRFRLQIDQCPYRCRFYPFPYYLGKCTRAEEAAKTTVVIDQLVLLEEELDLRDVAGAIDKIRQNKHEL